MEAQGHVCGGLCGVPTSKLLKALGAVDGILKASGILPEWQEILSLESRFAKLTKGEWKKRVDKAIRTAKSMTGPTEPDDVDAKAEKIAKAIDKVFDNYEKSVDDVVSTVVEDSYLAGIRSINRKVQGKYKGSLEFDFVPVEKAPIDAELEASFTVADSEAIDALHRRQTIWIGEHYSRKLSASVRDFVREVLVREGRDPETVVDEMQRVLRQELLYDTANPFEGSYARLPVGWRGSVDSYFENLGANVATVGRVAGQLSALSSAGVEHYVIVNPLDERTCPECSDLADNSVAVEGMPVEEAWEMQRKEFRATPEVLRETLHPWSKLSVMREVTGVSGTWKSRADASKFIKAGYGFPPFHFSCRCTVDLA